MTNLVFFEDNRSAFLPLVFTRPIAKLRVGIQTIEEKWQNYFEEAGKVEVSYLTEDYLSNKYGLKTNAENVFINSRFLPDRVVVDFIVKRLKNKEALMVDNTMLAMRGELGDFQNASYEKIPYNETFFGLELQGVTDIFLKNEAALIADFEQITRGRVSATLSDTNKIIGDAIFVEDGAKVEASILNSTNGPIYIGKNAEIMEGSVVRGPFALCDNAVLKLSTKIYGPTTIGPYSKVGGEVNNSVLQGFSNKGHDGFLGNSVIGEWCNLGADTNTSNLKNNYGEVKSWSYDKENYANTGLQFCGLIMGDHSKCGINTMFNTGTVVGVSANIYGADFPSKFIPSYSWGGADGFVTFDLKKSFEVAKNVMQRRSIDFTSEDRDILTAIFDITSKYRD